MTAGRGGRRYRSMLFLSGHHLAPMLDSPSSGADAVMFDLEDMVPVAEKATARTTIAHALAALRTERLGRFVRINGWSTGNLLDDLLAIVGAGLDGIGLPKAENVDDVKSLDRILSELERSRGLTPGSIEIIPLAEPAAGMWASFDLASASTRVKRFYGVANATQQGDGARSLNLRLSRSGQEWIPVGVHILLGARAAGITHLLGATAMEPDDLANARALAELSKGYGADGALCIHRSHVPILNEVYSPTAAEIEHSRAMLVTVDAAIRKGESTAIVDGELATYSHVRTALDMIRMAREMGLPVGPVPDFDIPDYAIDGTHHT